MKKCSAIVLLLLVGCGTSTQQAQVKYTEQECLAAPGRLLELTRLMSEDGQVPASEELDEQFAVLRGCRAQFQASLEEGQAQMGVIWRGVCEGRTSEMEGCEGIPPDSQKLRDMHNACNTLAYEPLACQNLLPLP